MKNLLLIIATFVATAISAQDLSFNIQETYHGGVGIPDSVYVLKILNVEATEAAWDKERPDLSGFEMDGFTCVGQYGTHAIHTWTEEGVFVIFCMRDGEVLGESTFFIINEKYVEYVVSNLPGIMIEETFVRTDIEWVARQAKSVVMIR